MPHGERHDPDDRHHGRLFEARGQGQRDAAEREVPVGREQQRGDGQRDHHRVVMGAADDVHDHERVQHPQPDRLLAAHADAFGEARQRIRDDRHRQQRRKPHRHRREIGVVAGQPHDEVLHLEGGRPVGGGRVEPEWVHLVRVRAGHGDGSGLVGVHPAGDHEPLGRVAVRITAEQRRAPQDRDRPERPGGGGRRAGAGDRTQPQPRVEQQDDPDGQDDRGGEPPHAVLQPAEAQGVDDGGAGWQEGRRHRPRRDEEHRQHPASDEGVADGVDQLGPDAADRGV